MGKKWSDINWNFGNGSWFTLTLLNNKKPSKYEQIFHNILVHKYQKMVEKYKPPQLIMA